MLGHPRDRSYEGGAKVWRRRDCIHRLGVVSFKDAVKRAGLVRRGLRSNLGSDTHHFEARRAFLIGPKQTAAGAMAPNWAMPVSFLEPFNSRISLLQSRY
jgi:hypothetical protein